MSMVFNCFSEELGNVQQRLEPMSLWDSCGWREVRGELKESQTHGETPAA